MMRATCPECGRVFDLLDEHDADEYHSGHDCEPVETCDECGAIEGPLGCPTCDAMSHAEISVQHDGRAMFEGWREDDRMGMPVIHGTADTLHGAITVALHHECPMMFLTIPDPRPVPA